MPAPFWGKYRGTVVAVADPLKLGRVQVEVPAVLGDTRLSWAMPCVPFAGPGVGLVAIPPVGAHIWVEFEGGDPDYPIWTGCFWGPAEFPLNVPAKGVSVLRVGDMALIARDQQDARAVLPRSGSARAATEVAVSGASVVVSRGGRAIVTIDDNQVAVKLGAVEVLVTTRDAKVTAGPDGATLTMSADAVELARSPQRVKVSAQGIDLTTAAAKVTVGPAKVELTCSPASVEVGSGQIKLANGAASVAVTPLMVNLNNGALEVT